MNRIDRPKWVSDKAQLVHVVVPVWVDNDNNQTPDLKEALTAASQGVQDALERQEGNGFVHDYDTSLSLHVDQEGTSLSLHVDQEGISPIPGGEGVRIKVNHHLTGPIRIPVKVDVVAVEVPEKGIVVNVNTDAVLIDRNGNQIGGLDYDDLVG